MLSGVTDYLDGYLARRLNQTSRLGQILDPVADRLYILAVVIGLALRDIIPWWVAIILPLRDVLLWGLVPILRTRGYSALPVHFLGKAATFNLLYAFPLLLLGDGTGSAATLAKVFGWAFAGLGDRALLVGRASSTPGRSASWSPTEPPGGRSWLRPPPRRPVRARSRRCRCSPSSPSGRSTRTTSTSPPASARR